MFDNSKTIIGSEEWCSLPDLNIKYIKARIDSGAKTSALHAFNIQAFVHNGKNFVRFNVHPLQGKRKIVQKCVAELVDLREIRSSSGHSEKRHIIKTTLKLGNKSWEVEVSLYNRDSMGYRLLLGRQAMLGRLIVDPDGSFLINKISEKKVEEAYKVSTIRRSNLRILVLASDPNLYSNKRLMEAGLAMGHDMQFLSIKECYLNLTSSNPRIFYGDGRALGHIDAVIPRLRPSMTFYGCSILRQLESSGVFCLNSPTAITRSRDKLRSLQLLSNKGVDMPNTAFANSPQKTRSIIKLVGGAPIIIKPLEGTQGRGIVLAETNKAAESVINAFKSLNVHILVQEYIKEAKNCDLRCFVIGNKVVASMLRRAADGEFRANVHLGATTEKVRITSEERKMAVKAVKILGLKVAGVDILRLPEGPKILEVNSSPGLEGIEKVTGIDVAKLIMRAVEKKLSE